MRRFYEYVGCPLPVITQDMKSRQHPRGTVDAISEVSKVIVETTKPSIRVMDLTGKPLKAYIEVAGLA